MTVTPYLMFNGQCEAAFAFYARHLGGVLEGLMRMGEAPGCEQLPKEFHHRVMHACLRIGDFRIMASDQPPQYPFEAIKGCSVALGVDSIEDAERVFSALSQGGDVRMPLAETFWATRFGMVTDQFGVPWMVNFDKAA